ncbi:MAG: uracil-DNA glycosylase family protein [Neomegalonema sp.]|nr:uracil-DNA glycosylase family protein [Neomegalonema sp.]
MDAPFFELIPASLLDVSGKAYYSRAFDRPSSVYLLGANPGGDPSEERETVREHTAKFLQSTEPRNEHLDDAWKPSGPTPLQRRMRHLGERCDLDLRAVPTSNLVFQRTRKLADLGGLRPAADPCWPFHQAVIAQLGVRVVICLGGEVGEYVARRMGADRVVDEFTETHARRSWRSWARANGDGAFVISLTHPGRADWTAPESDPSPMVARILKSNRDRT